MSSPARSFSTFGASTRPNRAAFATHRCKATHESIGGAKHGRTIIIASPDWDKLWRFDDGAAASLRGAGEDCEKPLFLRLATPFQLWPGTTDADRSGAGINRDW